MLRSSAQVVRDCAAPLALVVLTAWAPFSLAAVAWVLVTFDVSLLRLDSEALASLASSFRPNPVFWAGLLLLPLTYVVAVSLVSAAGAIAADEHEQGKSVSFRPLLSRSWSRTPRSMVAYVAITGSSAVVCILVFLTTLLISYVLARIAGLTGPLLLAAIFTAALVMALAGVASWMWLYSRLALAPVAAAVGPRGVFSLTTSFAISRQHAAGILGRAIVVALVAAAVVSVPATLALLGQLAGVWLGLTALAARAGLSMAGALLQTVALTQVYRSAGQREDVDPQYA